MSDSFTQFENAAIQALQSADANEQTDHLAQMLLNAAAHGRQQTALVAAVRGDMAQVNGKLTAEQARSRQFDTNVSVQQAINQRNLIAAETAINNAENRAAKAAAGKQKALDNLRPAYHALKQMQKFADEAQLTEKQIGARVRQMFADAL